MKKEALVRPFPENLIKTRKGAFGNRLSYVEGSHYIARLNDALNFEWSFEIVEHHVKGREMVVLGKLTAGNVSKMAFGGSPITMSRESGEIVSQADDLKSAATDALKKACSLLGVGLHLYGNTEPARRASANGPSKGDGRPGNGLPGSNSRPAEPGVRLTQKQLSAIWAMARSLGMNSETIRDQCLERFDAHPEFLDRSQASSLIGELSEALESEKKQGGSR